MRFPVNGTARPDPRRAFPRTGSTIGVQTVRVRCAADARRPNLEADDPEAYARALDGAREDVLVIAARRGLAPAAITVRFDAGRDPGPHEEHVLTLSTADHQVVVEERGIPHQWIAILGTGYIDVRFVRRVTALLFRFERKAAELGIRV